MEFWAKRCDFWCFLPDDDGFCRGGEKVGKWKAWCILNSRCVPHNLKNWSNLSDWRRSCFVCDMAIFLVERFFLSSFFVMRRFLAVCFCVFDVWRPKTWEKGLKMNCADSQAVRRGCLVG